MELGWPDLNRRMRESKSRALPLGDTPMLVRRTNAGHTMYYSTEAVILQSLFEIF